MLPALPWQVLLSAAWVDQAICGVAFCGDGGDAVAAAAYDCDEIRIWLPPPR